MLISLGSNGNIGNKIFRFMYCRNLQDMLTGATLACVKLPEFGLDYDNLEPYGRVLHIKDGHLHDMASLCYKLANGIYDSILFDGYVQRLEYYPNRDEFARTLMSGITVDRSHLGSLNITINIRGGEVLRNTHPDYNPVPISFYENIANSTRLDPVIMGQLLDDRYSEEIRKRFSGCVFLPHRSPIEDFEIVRNSTNIVSSVSSFSWLASWLSTTAQTIHIPVSGFLNPRQRPDIDLLPTRDKRYYFYEFPIFQWQATEQQYQALFATAPIFHQITSAEARALII